MWYDIYYIYYLTEGIPWILNFTVLKREVLKIYKIESKMILMKSKYNKDKNSLKQRYWLHYTSLNIKKLISVCVCVCVFREREREGQIFKGLPK